MARSTLGWLTAMVARWVASASILTVLVCTLSGCGSDLGATVSGTVTLDGKAVGPGMITFVPVKGATNPSDGAIQIDGSYSLKTGREVGLKPGRYRASATVLDQPDVQPGERSYEAPKLVTPQKYADPSTSGLEYDVTTGRNTIDVVLTSK